METTAGVKYDIDKPKFSLMKHDALLEMVKVLTFGAQKYSPDNWRKLDDARTRYFDAANRHMWQWFSNERYDSESGYHHLAHAMASLMFIMQMDLEDADDRQLSFDFVFDDPKPSEPHGW
jgi:hypothetical protein